MYKNPESQILSTFEFVDFLRRLQVMTIRSKAKFWTDFFLRKNPGSHAWKHKNHMHGLGTWHPIFYNESDHVVNLRYTSLGYKQDEQDKH